MVVRDPTHLYAALSTEFNSYILEQRSQSERDILIFPASEADRLGQALFANLNKGGFCTVVVTARNDWDPRSHYYEAARSAARRGCNIHRAFLLPHRHCRHDPTLQIHLQLDHAAGIHTQVLFVGDLLAILALPMAESLEFGLWDESVGCVGIFGSSGLAGGITEWRITSRPEDIQTLEEIRSLLQQQAQDISLTSSECDSPDLEEPMIITAPIAHELATVLCQGDRVGLKTAPGIILSGSICESSTWFQHPHGTLTST